MMVVLSHISVEFVERFVNATPITGDRRVNYRRLVQRHVLPSYRKHGRAAIEPLLEQLAHSKVAGTVLLELCGDLGKTPLEFFSHDEIVQAAAQDLVDECAGTTSGDDSWGLMALWSDQFTFEEHWQLIEAVVERVPDDDCILWLLGDGPIAEFEMRRGGVAHVEEAARQNPRFRRIRELVEEIP